MLEQKSRLVFVKAVGAHLCYHSHNERKTPQVCLIYVIMKYLI